MSPDFVDTMKRPAKRAVRPRTIAALAVFAAAAPTYLLTMSRAVGFVDRGELAAVAVTLGVAHPTGYPTLTLLGHLATKLLPARPLVALNVLASLLSAAGAALLVLVFDHVLARFAPAAHRASSCGSCRPSPSASSPTLGSPGAQARHRASTGAIRTRSEPSCAT